mgnify:CR=1 FL=1
MLRVLEAPARLWSRRHGNGSVRGARGHAHPSVAGRVRHLPRLRWEVSLHIRNCVDIPRIVTGNNEFTCCFLTTKKIVN